MIEDSTGKNSNEKILFRRINNPFASHFQTVQVGEISMEKVLVLTGFDAFNPNICIETNAARATATTAAALAKRYKEGSGERKSKNGLFRNNFALLHFVRLLLFFVFLLVHADKESDGERRMAHFVHVVRCCGAFSVYLCARQRQTGARTKQNAQCDAKLQCFTDMLRD